MEKIKRLNDRDKAREKLSIWYGSRDNFTHGLKEMIANAADELRNNEVKNPTVIIELKDNKEISVEDNGRGINIEQVTDGVPNYELLFETLFAGTKYDVTEDIQTGTNGVGTTVLNFTSSLFDVKACHNGFQYEVKYENGGYLSGDKLTKTKIDKNKTSSKFTVILDESQYTRTIFEPSVVDNIVKHYAGAAYGINFIFKYNDENNDIISKEYCYKDAKEYFEDISPAATTSPIFTFGKANFEEKIQDLQDKFDKEKVYHDEKNSYEVFFTTSPQVVQETYLNMTFLQEGGMIFDGILDGIRLWLNKYCRENKLFPNKVTSFNKDDISSSITFLGIVESNVVEFANQTKLSTNKEVYKNQVKKYMSSTLELAEKTNKKGLLKLVKHILEVQKFNATNVKAREKLVKKLVEKVDGIGNKVAKLIDCEQHGANAELFLTEGDSANGSIVDSRDDDFQAAFPLRGKVLNVLKAKREKIFANEEIINMVKIIGTGITDVKKNDFDISKARYGKIILTTDADADGGHIASLLIAFIYKYMKPLLENGMVYVAQTPLYELKFKDDKVVYFLTEDEKNKNIGKYDGQKYVINRIKGLGEIDAEVMYNTSMNPKTRRLTRLTVTDVKKMDNTVIDWMGDSVDNRKIIITDQIKHFSDNID